MQYPSPETCALPSSPLGSSRASPRASHEAPQSEGGMSHPNELPRRVLATSSSGTGEYSKTLLAHQRLDLVAVPAEAEEDALVDHDRGHR